MQIVKFFKVAILFVSFSPMVSAQVNTSGSRQRMLMDVNWKFSQTDTIGADKQEFNDNGWRTLNIPHDWSIENEFVEDAPTTGRGGYLPTGIGWYRKQFVLPKSATAKDVWIEFDGVYQNSDVWINGHHLGHYPNGYMSFFYDLTPHIKPGKNVIAVRVNNSRQPNTRWYSGSGIYRHVWLNMADHLHVSQWGTYITNPVADSTSATVDVKTTIENKNASLRDAILRSLIIDPTGKEVREWNRRYPFLQVKALKPNRRWKLLIPPDGRWNRRLCTRFDHRFSSKERL